MNCVLVFVCVCVFVFAVTEPTPGERKAIGFLCLGNKHTKLFSQYPSLFKRRKQVLWVEAMKLMDRERKNSAGDLTFHL